MYTQLLYSLYFQNIFFNVHEININCLKLSRNIQDAREHALGSSKFYLLQFFRNKGTFLMDYTHFEKHNSKNHCKDITIAMNILPIKLNMKCTTVNFLLILLNTSRISITHQPIHIHYASRSSYLQFIFKVTSMMLFWNHHS